MEDYARQAARWASCGTLDAVVTQDYMCEPHILDLTGLTVPQHQQLSTGNFLALRELVPHLYVMPVIQGYTPEEYADHARQLSPDLPDQAWTGVGSLCKRQGSPSRISAIITAIKNVRPDLKLHGFGLKTTALCRADIWHRFHSVDSAAWSYAARRRGQPRTAIPSKPASSGPTNSPPPTPPHPRWQYCETSEVTMTGIEWTDATWNPLTGCTKVSPGCDRCYMYQWYPRLKAIGAKGYEKSPDQITTVPDRLLQPLSWKKPRTVFVASMSDIFHSKVPQGIPHRNL